MLLFKVIAFVIFTIIALITMFQNTNTLSVRFQKHTVNQMMQVFGDTEGWDDPWAKYLSKFIVIFLGLMFILLIYVAIFSI